MMMCLYRDGLFALLVAVSIGGRHSKYY